jgi:hypothetical protein
VVVSWGFIPDSQLEAVLALRTLGFRWIWLDGDRELALREYLALGRLRYSCDRHIREIVHVAVSTPKRRGRASASLDPYSAASGLTAFASAPFRPRTDSGTGVRLLPLRGRRPADRPRSEAAY